MLDAFRLAETTDRRVPLYALLFAAVALGGDYLTGPQIHFPILFTLPVMLAAWFGYVGWAFAITVALSLGRLVLATEIWRSELNLAIALTNVTVYATVLVIQAVLLFRAGARIRELSLQLRTVYGQKTLCPTCHRIRTDAGHWQPIDAYIAAWSQTQITRESCPACVTRPDRT